MTATTTNPSPAPAAPLATTQPAPPSTALARRSEEDLFKFGLEPQSIPEALAICKQIADAGMFATKDGPATAGGLLVRVLTGRSLGVPMMPSMRNIHEIYGNPTVSARLKKSLAKRHPECERFEMTELTDTACTYVAKRRGEKEQEFRFTIEMAIAAQLGGSEKNGGKFKPESNWAKHVKRMLSARASSWAADEVFGDATMGLPTDEEAEEDLRPGEMRGEVVPPPAAVPVRDWPRETDALKLALDQAVAANDEKALKAVRERMKAFHKEAPPSFGEDVARHYAKQARKPAAAPATSGATPAPAAATAAAAPAPDLPKCVMCNKPVPPVDAVQTEARDGSLAVRHKGCPPFGAGDSWEPQ